LPVNLDVTAFDAKKKIPGDLDREKFKLSPQKQGLLGTISKKKNTLIPKE
jgi:hypothetical protein